MLFPDSQALELESLLPSMEHVNPVISNGDTWKRILEKQPEILITGWKTPSLPEQHVREVADNLKYICHVGGSVRKLVPRAYIEAGIKVTNWGGTVCHNVAECALLLILSALRRSAYWSIQMHCRGGWKDENLQTETLIGKRVGIHGFGYTARSLVNLLKPFQVEIMAHSDCEPDRYFTAMNVRRASSLEELFDWAEVMIDLAPGTPDNFHIVDEPLLRRLQENAVFVNIGRGSVVDTDALLTIAREGRMQIALDVYEEEPLPKDSGFRGLPNVTLLPHLGGPTVDFRRNCGLFALNNLKRYLTGDPLEAEVSLEIYDRAT